MDIYKLYFESPIGIIKIETNDTSLLSVSIVAYKKKSSKIIPNIIRESYKQIQEYFEGERMDFSLRINLDGTEFQKKVWNELLNIPCGDIDTYKGIAERIGNVKASRAVGNANNKNKLLIVIPCHRVIGSDGRLNGYRAGIKNKKWLLEHENKMKNSLP